MIAIDSFIILKVCNDANQKKWVNREVKNAVENKKKPWNKIRKDKTNNQALITGWKHALNFLGVTNSARIAFESRFIQNCNFGRMVDLKLRTQVMYPVYLVIIILYVMFLKKLLLNNYFVTVFSVEPDDFLI